MYIIYIIQLYIYIYYMSFQFPDSQFLAKRPVFRAASRQRRGRHRGTGGLVNEPNAQT